MIPLGYDIMTIPELTLEKWSRPSGNMKAKETYMVMKDLIKDNMENVDPLLQGSFANATHVNSSTSLDIIVLFTEYGYNTGGGNDVKYARDILYRALDGKNGMQFDLGNKAVRFEGDETYFPMNIVPCVKYVLEGEAGVIVYDHNRKTYTISYPIQHKKFGKMKDEDTNGNFKNAVRMFKNARDFAISRRILSMETSPSYGLESLIYNVPDSEFSGSVTDVFHNVMMWLHNNPAISEMVRQNNIQPLFGDSISSWNIKDARTTIDKISYVWGAWDQIQ